MLVFDLVFQTRVLVTNAISFLPQVDQIIVLVDGQITEIGSYRELVEKVQYIHVFTKKNRRTRSTGRATCV